MLSPTIRGRQGVMRLLVAAQTMLLVASLVAVAPVTAADPSPDPSAPPAPSADPSAPPSADPSPTPSNDPSPTPSNDPSPTPSADPSPTPRPSVTPSPAVTIRPHTNTGTPRIAPQAASVSALQLNGSSQYATLGASGNLQVSQFTLELWFKRVAGGVTQSTGSGGVVAYPLITKGRAEVETPAADVNYFLGIDAAGHLAADFEEAAGGTSPSLNHPITGAATIATDNTWHHAAATYDGTTWRLYLDGALDGTLSVGQPANNASAAVTAIGSTQNAVAPLGAAGFFAGVVDEVRIWNTARSLAQIKSTKNIEITSPQPPTLIGVWNLNAGSGTSLADNSGNSVTGTAVGGPTWVTGFVPPSGNPPNAPTLNAPANGSSGVSTSPTLSVGVSDPNADPLTVTSYRHFRQRVAMRSFPSHGRRLGHDQHHALGGHRLQREDSGGASAVSGADSATRPVHGPSFLAPQQVFQWRPR